MTEADYDKKYHWMLKHGDACPMQFRHTRDIKFRFTTDKWLFFFQHVHIVEEVLNKNPNLKEHIYGENNMSFRFDSIFLKTKSDLNQHHSRQISRTESNQNIEFDSFWTLCEETWKYTLEDSSMPLADADRV